MIVLIDLLFDARQVYSEQKINVGKNPQKSHVSFKLKVELKKQQLSQNTSKFKKLLQTTNTAEGR